ncbi:hypothetical protein BJ508DRAFT_333830 [Ascobolus immersus RN42]|uniref:Uncharacterized protein n=1 Tax=Ascobolus immersus RN42 TaxID=1160509 RepID=A0A3N4HLC8_ASCIM|nr:hypothetical protein BJ508DRAFT_333830 [Ascobolus immersus RN42]
MTWKKQTNELKARIQRLKLNRKTLNLRVDVFNARQHDTRENWIEHLRAENDLCGLDESDMVFQAMPRFRFRHPHLTRKNIAAAEAEYFDMESWFTQFRIGEVFNEMVCEARVECSLKGDRSMIYKAFEYGKKHGMFDVLGGEPSLDQICTILDNTQLEMKRLEGKDVSELTVDLHAAGLSRVRED